MSHKSQKAAEPAEVAAHEHDDDLIVVPKGHSRLRYIATIGLVLFLLVIFVVADTFQSAMTGGGGSPDTVYISWEDPVDGSPNEVMESDFFATSRLLKIMTSFQIYLPDSYMYGEAELGRRRTPEPSEEDVASFFVFEDLAIDAGVDVSQKEHVDLLRGRFVDAQGLRVSAAQARMPVSQFEDSIRRVARVSKLRSLLMSTSVVPDADAIVTRWQDDHPEYKFQVVTAKRSEYVVQAKSEVPDDETLATWFHERPQFEQERLYTEARVVPEVAYVPLDAEANFDPTALLAAYPSPEGVDLDEQARNYHRQFRNTRFRVPPEEQNQESEGETEGENEGENEGDDEPESTDPTNDGEQTDADKAAAAENAQETPPKLFYEFEEVEERVRAEAPIHAALGAFLTDLQDRKDAGEEIDMAAEAARVGLVHTMASEEGYERDEIGEVEGWGSAMIAGQLIFGAEGSLLPRVVVSENAMTIARVAAKKDREEPPFAEIRDDVSVLWADDRASELAVETLETVRGVLAAKPEDVESADWLPVIDKEALQQLAVEAGYAFYDRPWLERMSMPNDDFVSASPADRHIRSQESLFTLEPGQVAPAAKSLDGNEAFLVRFDSKRLRDPSEIDAQTLLQMRQMARSEDRNEFGAKVFLGDGPWLTERAKLRFPERDRREAERASKEAGEDSSESDGASDQAG